MEYKISKVEPKEFLFYKQKFGFSMKFEDGVVLSLYPYVHVYIGRLVPDVEAHEMVHLERQKAIGVDNWVDNYLQDEKFRMNEELLAYRAQYQWVLKHMPERTHFFNLKFYAESFCKLYGFKNMSITIAMSMIRQK